MSKLFDMSSLRCVYGKNRRRKQSSAGRAVTRRFAPTLESLEDRLALMGMGFLQGTAFVDDNLNDQLDPNETYLPGVSISLYNEDGSTLLDTAVTNATGGYRFEGLNPGNYLLVQTNSPTGFDISGAQVLSQISPGVVNVDSTISVSLIDPDALTITFDSDAFFGRDLWEVVSFDAHPDPYSVGQLPITVSGPDGFLSPEFLAYCADFFHDLSGGVDVYDVLGRPTDELDANQGRVAYLFNQYATNDIDAAFVASIPELSGFQARHVAAGLQVALWELQSDAATDFSTGAFANVTYEDGGFGPPFEDFWTSATEFVDIMAAADFFITDSVGTSELAIFLDATKDGTIPETPENQIGRQGMLATGSFNFAHVPGSASIGDFVWDDQDFDGIQDAGEPGLSKVNINLLDAGGSLISSTVSAPGGSYSFTGLSAGDYIVEFVPGGVAVITLQDQGGDDGLDSDADVFTGRTGVISLAVGEANLSIDTGVISCPTCFPGSAEIDIEKATNGEDADAPTGPIVAVGDTVTFTYEVRNPAEMPLQNVVVSDDNGTPGDNSDDFAPTFTGGDDNNNGRLDAGEVWMYEATAVAAAGQYVNTATVTGEDPLGRMPIDEDLSHHFGHVAVCLDTVHVDFETDAAGDWLDAGTVIAEQWASLGMHVTTNSPYYHPAMIFDSNQPTGGDTDLGTPNSDFGGPGIGNGGEMGMPGENSTYQDNILIISEDGDSTDPDDNAGGGTLIFTFDDPVRIMEVHLLDIDSNEPGGTIVTYDAAGNVISTTPSQNLSNNSFQIVAIDDENVSRMEVNLVSSGAVTDLIFEREKACPIPGNSSLSGFVYLDGNDDGVMDGGESGIEGVLVTLTGTNDLGDDVNESMLTSADGSYAFTSLRPGTYTLGETQPEGVADGMDTVGSAGAAAVLDDVFADIALADGVDGALYNFGEIPESTVHGIVWHDTDDDGEIDVDETAIEGAVVHLTGTNDHGEAVDMTTMTDADGVYLFGNLRPSDADGYMIREEQPAGFDDGMDIVGTVNDLAVGFVDGNDKISGVVLGLGESAEGYNFGELSPETGEPLQHGQTATIGFWQNKRGQSLIKSLNGSPYATGLSTYLAETFPNMYGAQAGDNDLTGMTNKQVARFYKDLFKQHKRSKRGRHHHRQNLGPAKLDPQAMAVLLATYVTNESLAGTVAQQYGFITSATGVGSALFDIDAAVFSGAAEILFGEGTESVQTVLNIMTMTDAQSSNGLLFDRDGNGRINFREWMLRIMANVLFTSINESGDING